MSVTTALQDLFLPPSVSILMCLSSFLISPTKIWWSNTQHPWAVFPTSGFSGRFQQSFRTTSPGHIPTCLLQEISLPSNGLSGPLSPGIIKLTNIKILELYGNQLTGFISPDIGKLYNLEQLLLHINNLTGPLPASLANCTNLVTLNLRFNNLEGDLVAFNFSKLVKLRILDLGQILPKIVGLKSLSFLSLSHNNLTNVTGAMSVLKRLKSLRILLLSKNFWNESMPNDDKIGQSDGFQNLESSL
ncbi:hypothetical protein GH714_004954 [Hevea brasiliensis]|uniref:Leucine-rich repeat-containing N-terminal plant-type domain-containing protein n=1 Tax=Hevea brasiliensis TaxID=3981 RepID=A0A6A6L0F4_HEVBR|nr:hypothetical protein GH714_004954 [Hevea brasiliensis]